MTNKVWDDFREACKHVFNNYRTKKQCCNRRLEKKITNKNVLLDELKEIGDEEGSVEKKKKN